MESRQDSHIFQSLPLIITSDYANVPIKNPSSTAEGEIKDLIKSYINSLPPANEKILEYWKFPVEDWILIFIHS